MGTFKIKKVVLRSLFSKPATKISAENPIIIKDWKELTRGHVDIDVNECIMCGMCMRKCPANAITVDRASGTWEIQRMQCIQCANCVDVCPKKCLSMGADYTEPGVEKVIDTFEIPQKEKPAAPAKKDAPAEKAEAPAAGGDGVCVDMEKCVLCGMCGRQCPVGAITVDRDSKTWSIDREACVQCGMCVGGCPVQALEMGPVTGDSFTKGEAKVEEPAEEPKAEEPAEEAPAEAPAEEAKEAPAEAAEGGVNCNADTCILCGACAGACPVGAITVDGEWKIDKSACVQCGSCVGSCPVGALTMA